MDEIRGKQRKRKNGNRQLIDNMDTLRLEGQFSDFYTSTIALVSGGWAEGGGSGCLQSARALRTRSSSHRFPAMILQDDRIPLNAI